MGWRDGSLIVVSVAIGDGDGEIGLSGGGFGVGVGVGVWRGGCPSAVDGLAINVHGSFAAHGCCGKLREALSLLRRKVKRVRIRVVLGGPTGGRMGLGMGMARVGGMARQSRRA